MPTFLPNSMLKTLRADDFNSQADADQAALVPEPESTPPAPAPEPAKPSFSLPSWSDLALGAGQAVQQAGQQVQEKAQSFKIPDWSSFQLGGPSNADQVKQQGGPAGAASLPSWDSFKLGGGNSTGASSTPGSPSPDAGGAMASSPSAPSAGPLQDYARQAAQKAGVDPDIFVRQIQQESGFNPSAASPAGAQGIAQFMPATAAAEGVADPSDPYQSLDGAARLMGRLLQKYGGDYSKALSAYNAGEGNTDSGAAAGFGETQTYIKNILGDAQPIPKAQAGDAALAPIGRASSGDQQVVDQAALDDPDKWALCGPVAAVLAAAAHGADWTVAQAKGIATKLGLWDAGNGMHGLDSEVALLKQAGVSATTGPADEQRLAADAQNGNTPIVSTDGHYFVLQGYDPASGKFDTGSTGTVYRGGSRWLSLADMQALAGTIQGAAYMDNPASPAPSLVAQAASKGAGLQGQRQADQSSGDSTFGPFDPPGYGDGNTNGRPDPIVPGGPPTRGGSDNDSGATGSQSGAVGDSGVGTPDQPSGLSRPVTSSATPTFVPEPEPGALLPVVQPPDNRGWPGQVSDAAQHVAQGGLSQDLQDFLPKLGQDINARTQALDPDAERRAKLNAAMEASNLPEAAKIALRGMTTFGDAVTYLNNLMGSAAYEGIRDTVIKPLLAAVGAEKHVDLPILGEQGTADLVAGALPIVGQLGPMAHAPGMGRLINPSETVIGRGVQAAGDALGRLPGVQRAGEAITGLRDAAGAMTTGLPGGAPVASVVGADRYYHGTGGTFDRPNPAHFNLADSHGPAYYMTESPERAGHYSEMRAGGDASGANVRAIEVPRDLNLLDDRAPVPSAMVDAVERAFGAEAADAISLSRNVESAYDKLRGIVGGGTTIEQKYGSDAGQQINNALAAAGYDGFRYTIPGADGKPVRALGIFGQSLDKITNATSGRPGGLLPSPGASSPGSRLAGQAVGGAISGGYAASQEPDATPGSVLGGAALGAAGGVARGAIGSRGTTHAIANVVKATNLSDPNNQKLGQMFEKPVPTPATTTPWYRRLAQALTDDRALLYGWEKDVRARLGPNASATDLIGDLTRINPDSVASQRLKPVEEAAGIVRDAGVDPSVLSLYLAHTHDLDIADSFGMRAYDAATARGLTPAQAQTAYDRAANGRTFSGGRHVPDIQASLQSLQSDLTPDQMQAVRDAAQRIWDLNGETRDRLYAAGGMDQTTHADLATRYPHYVTTDIVNHIDPESGLGGGVGGGVSQRSNAIRELSAAGTASDRLDPLQSVVANTVRSERWIAKNTVFNAFHELVNADPALASQLGVTPNKPGGTKEVTGLVNGQRVTLRVARPIAEVLEMGNSTAAGMLGEALKALTGPFKAALTTYNPAFQFVVNPIRDATDFFTRQTAYLGGPQHLPEVMSAYAAVIKDVATEGKWTQAYKAAGGSYERVDTSAKGIANLTKDLTASGGEMIRDPRRIAALTRDVLTLGAKPFGERAELVPRVAAFKMAAERGASPVESMIAGRNSTVPFEVGGRLTKAFSTAIPFLNATVQAGAQLGRSFRDHPVATTASMATLVGLPALAAQAWNRSDPDRAAAYADVPDYLKRNGLVFMLPLTGSDKRGPLPNYVWIPLGNFAPAAMAMNTAVDAKMGDSSPDEFGKLLMGVLGSFSPIKGDSVGSAMAGVIPPGISTARDLMANRDTFRGRTIASDAADRNAGALAQGVTSGLHAIGEHVPPVAGLRDIRPSQTEYAIRDLTGAPGQIASSAANIASGKTDDRNRPIQQVPILGGLAGRIIRDTGGQQLQNAQDARISPEVDAALRDAGLHPNDVVAPVMASANGVPLDREQQLAYQTFMNGYLEREVANAMRTAAYRNPATREQALRDAVSAARQAAAARVLARIPSSQQEILKRQKAG